MQAMVNAAKLGGSALIMDKGMPVIASPKFLDKVKINSLNFENYKHSKKTRVFLNFWKVHYLRTGLLNGLN